MTAATIVHRNARIWTQDPGQPRADTMVVSGGRITAIGGAGLATGQAAAEVIDHQGAFVMPG